MSTAKRFSIYPCSLTYAGPTTVDLQQMQGFGVEPRPAIKRVYVGGAIDPKAHLLASADPQKPFATRDLTTLLGAVSPLTGLHITASTFRLQERDDAESVFLTGGTHETFTTTGGHVVIESISASQDDQEGSLAQCRLYALWDGTNLPIVHNTGVDFSAAPVPAFLSQFFMGPVYHNGAEVEGILNHQVDFGLVFAPFRTGGSPYPKQGYIARRQPMMRMTTLKSDVDGAVSLFARAASGTLAFYHWKGVDAGDRVAVGTASHLKISAATSLFSDDNHSVTDNDDGTCTISIMPKGSLAFSVSSAIP
jgi:hypothetical protein